MDEELNKKLSEIKEKLNCPYNYDCIQDISRDLCRAKYNASAGLLVCLQKDNHNCVFARPFDMIFICTCELRKEIAIHFDKI